MVVIFNVFLHIQKKNTMTEYDALLIRDVNILNNIHHHISFEIR